MTVSIGKILLALAIVGGLVLLTVLVIAPAIRNANAAPQVVEKVVEKPAEKVVEKLVEKVVVEKPAEKVVEKPAEKGNTGTACTGTACEQPAAAPRPFNYGDYERWTLAAPNATITINKGEIAALWWMFMRVYICAGEEFKFVQEKNGKIV
jgi:hypothetical protein